MVRTQLPTKSEYDQAVKELKKLNDDLFYDDFKEKITQLQQAVDKNNKDLVGKAIAAITPVSQNITEFTQKLSVSDERNNEFLAQNEAFVTFTKEQLAETEGKFAAHIATLQQMDQRLEQILQYYEEKFRSQTDSLKSILNIREEALIHKVTQHLQNWTSSQTEQNMELKQEILHWYEKVDSILKLQSEQNKKMLELISTKLSSKEDLANIDKKSSFKINMLLGIAVIEAILIGIKFFI